ncbi:MAG: hypothetical protein AAGB06_05100 [Verrucomicrobiota bacterium]
MEIINATEDDSTYNALIGALEDSDWWVRERAVDGLANLGNKQAASGSAVKLTGRVS